MTRGKRQAQAGGFFPDGKQLTWVSNLDGNRDIFLYDLAAKRARSLLLRKGVNDLGDDPRCPKSEAEQMANAVKKRGGIVDLKIYEDEGHGFTRIENEIDALKRISDFLKEYVPPADSPRR